jgi:prepilin-type N-terminal cleavage/methylation domain-containing protein
MTPAPGCARGLTLLEVLIATVLLTIMAATCVPVMAQAMRSLQTNEHAHLINATDLARFADSVIAHPELIGFKQQDELLKSDGVELPWPAQWLAERAASAPPVRLKVLRNADPKVDHAWLVFECDGLVVHRWLAVPAPKEATTP